MTKLVEPRPARSSGRPNTGPTPARLRPVEQTLYVLLSHWNTWYIVDRHTSTSSPLAVALRRRGCDVVARWDGDEYVHWARWTHDVPHLVAPWEEPA